MSSKNALRKKIGRCLRKRHYRTQAEALTFASLSLRRKSSNVSTLAVYNCPHCGGWHLTSHTKKGKPINQEPTP